MRKVKEFPGAPPTQEERRAKVDRYGELERQIALVDPAVTELKALKEEIEGWHAGDVSDKPVMETGNLYRIQMSPRRRERILLAKKKVWNALKAVIGLDALIALIDIPLGAAVDRYLPKSVQAGLVHEERSGYRTFAVVALQPAAEREEAA